MKYHISVGSLAVLLFGFILEGCAKPPDTKTQPPVPIASGELIHAYTTEGVPPAKGTDWTYKVHTYSQGHIVIYESGISIITDPDGTKHGLTVFELKDLSFR